MKILYNKLASEFLQYPIELHGIYKRTLKANGTYSGHKLQATTKCGFLFVLQGEATFQFNNTAYHVSEGSVLIGGYNMNLEITTISDFQYCLVHFLPSLYLLKEDLLMLNISVLRPGLEPQMLQLMEELLHLSAVPEALSQLEKKTIFFRLLSSVLAIERDRQQQAELSFISQTIIFIRHHYMDAITLKMLAKRYNVKPKYFANSFRAYTGLSPIHYLIQYRMNKAYELLVNSDFSVYEIAESVGYCDAHYFSRLFKKYRGMSPTEARRNRH